MQPAAAPRGRAAARHVNTQHRAEHVEPDEQRRDTLGVLHVAQYPLRDHRRERKRRRGEHRARGARTHEQPHRGERDDHEQVDRGAVHAGDVGDRPVRAAWRRRRRRADRPRSRGCPRSRRRSSTRTRRAPRASVCAAPRAGGSGAGAVGRAVPHAAARRSMSASASRKWPVTLTHSEPHLHRDPAEDRFAPEEPEQDPREPDEVVAARAEPVRAEQGRTRAGCRSRPRRCG